MYVFPIEDPNEGLGRVLRALQQGGIRTDSRNGPVVRFPRPVCLQYDNPRRRILSSAVRDANPVFHLVETIWMFGGMSALRPLLMYNAGMAQYSDDGSNLRGTAYGHRWRSYGWGDQLDKAVKALRANPDDRRVVMTMWDPFELGQTGKDFACNLQVIFNTRPSPDGSKPVLDMTVTNRSNDLIYGAMGSNMFHFSMLLEYVALLCDMEVGVYYQVSANLHLYTDNPTAARCLEQASLLAADHISKATDSSLTELGLPLDAEPMRAYISGDTAQPEPEYLRQVVAPLAEAYRVFKLKSHVGLDLGVEDRVWAACRIASACASPALRDATVAWFKRKLPTPAKVDTTSAVLAPSTGVLMNAAGK